MVAADTAKKEAIMNETILSLLEKLFAYVVDSQYMMTRGDEDINICSGCHNPAHLGCASDCETKYLIKITRAKIEEIETLMSIDDPKELALYAMTKKMLLTYHNAQFEAAVPEEMDLGPFTDLPETAVRMVIFGFPDWDAQLDEPITSYGVKALDHTGEPVAIHMCNYTSLSWAVDLALAVAEKYGIKFDHMEKTANDES